MATWSLKELRESFGRINNKNRSKIDLINSVGRSVAIFHYHLEQARDAMKDFHKNGEASDPEQFKVMFSDSEDGVEYEVAKLTNQANSIALILTVRSMYDIFAQLIRAMLLEDELTEKQCEISRVAKCLPDSDLKTTLNELLDSYSFKYVRAFSNVTKHRFSIEQSSTIDFEENRAGIQFKGFSYNDEKYPKMWSDELLRLVLEAKNQIVNCGNALNNFHFQENM
ncbi:hypothetical protein EDC38_1925 [Marinimicrobium koreense]|uniref:Cthe-2314-like HEPN domain-containing protein n=1 Tax=Marinimicrobium koreense TaxID=306545 RepID=A0A3N1NR46_9GAMM|nr:hypothetical protein [Marinimicrobium koreense]ROQ21302.1 hypothetical protein EDC38_1925 [Marinimicrobium koreense]